MTISESSLSVFPTSESSLSEIPVPEFSTPVSSTFASCVIDQISYISQNVNKLVTKVCDSSCDAKFLSPTGNLQTHSTELKILNYVLVTEINTFNNIVKFEQFLHKTVSFLKLCHSTKLKCIISIYNNISKSPLFSKSPVPSNNNCRIFLNYQKLFQILSWWAPILLFHRLQQNKIITFIEQMLC